MFAPRSTRAAALAMASAAILASIGVPSVAQAADPSHDKMMQMPKSYSEFIKMDPVECMKMIDHDNKGYVTKKEYMRFHEAFFKSMAKKNADRVTREEWLGEIHSAP
jgi:uncharacterized protein involved in copper resistance